MASHWAAGSALLISGFESGPRSELVEIEAALGQIGEALLACERSWRLRRLSPTAGTRFSPTRARIKTYLDELVNTASDCALVVVTGWLIETAAGPALVTGELHSTYPDDASLPLACIGERLRGLTDTRALVVLAGASGAGVSASDCLETLRTGSAKHSIAAHVGERAQLLGEVAAGLQGRAIDPRSGTITSRSIGDDLVRHVEDLELQPSLESLTLLTVPPLAGLWDPRLSTLAVRFRRPAGDVDLIGAVLPGRFRIDAEIARGGFGTVYQARQIAIERDVAIKVLHAGLDPRSDEGRLFVQEIQSVGRIDNPHVLRIHQADITFDGRLFFAMELLVGRDLQQEVDEGGVLPRERAVELTCQLLDGLGAAHDAGLVHADVKPANAFVARTGDRVRLVLLDFGLARLRGSGAVESAGGTPAFMAPEQLDAGRVDARSDLFSAALVLVFLLTSWRRRAASEKTPPLDGIDDPALRAVLERALKLEPDQRYPNAAAFRAALAGETTDTVALTPGAPFRRLVPFTEADRGRLFGREREIAALVDRVLYGDVVIYAAPSGTGKSSLLRAGLVPRLEALGVEVIYATCHPGDTQAIEIGSPERQGRLVVVVDQVEAALGAEAVSPALDELLGSPRWTTDQELALVLAVREDFLGRLIAASSRRGERPRILRLGPLDREAAREAIVGPLAEQRLEIEPELLTAVLDDLAAAAQKLGVELGWDRRAAAYPPHLQLVGASLYESLAPGEAVVQLTDYRRLGGFDAIVGEHVDRVLETELDGDDSTVARRLFLALVSAAQTRAVRPESELLAELGSTNRERVSAVLEILRARGLVVRRRDRSGVPVWELIHDSMVPRVLAWVDRRDLARRQAIELVRHHLRRSQPEALSLLGAGELREVRRHREALAELDAEYANRRHAPISPSGLIARSIRARRRRRTVALAGVAVLLAVAGVAVAKWFDERSQRQVEQSLRDRNLGRFMLELEPFDWDAETQTVSPIPATALPALGWELHEIDPDDPLGLGPPLPERAIVAGEPVEVDGRRVEQIEARGGPALLEINGRGRGGRRCPPSVIAVADLPGYARRHELRRLRIRVPTCQVSLADTIAVPAGPFVYGGLGEPPSPYKASFANLRRAATVELPAYRIDRTEITNAAFAVFAEMAPVTGVAMPGYADTAELQRAGDPRSPVAGIDWLEAGAYCRFLGKRLPSSREWEKALRGGSQLDGRPNPHPVRNLPWGGETIEIGLANLNDIDGRGPRPVGSFPTDASPYGVVDLGGNVQEWTRSLVRAGAGDQFPITRGGNWDETSTSTLVDFMAIENPRPPGTRTFIVGARCVSAPSLREHGPSRPPP